MNINKIIELQEKIKDLEKENKIIHQRFYMIDCKYRVRLRNSFSCCDNSKHPEAVVFSAPVCSLDKCPLK